MDLSSLFFEKALLSCPSLNDKLSSPYGKVCLELTLFEISLLGDPVISIEWDGPAIIWRSGSGTIKTYLGYNSMSELEVARVSLLKTDWFTTFKTLYETVPASWILLKHILKVPMFNPGYWLKSLALLGLVCSNQIKNFPTFHDGQWSEPVNQGESYYYADAVAQFLKQGIIPFTNCLFTRILIEGQEVKIYRRDVSQYLNNILAGNCFTQKHNTTIVKPSVQRSEFELLLTHDLVTALPCIGWKADKKSGTYTFIYPHSWSGVFIVDAVDGGMQYTSDQFTREGCTIQSYDHPIKFYVGAFSRLGQVLDCSTKFKGGIYWDEYWYRDFHKHLGGNITLNTNNKRSIEVTDIKPLKQVKEDDEELCDLIGEIRTCADIPTLREFMRKYMDSTGIELNIMNLDEIQKEMSSLGVDMENYMQLKEQEETNEMK